MVISSVFDTTQRLYALFAADISQKSETVPLLALLIAASISSLAIPTLSESLTKLFLIGSICAAASIEAFQIAVIPATTAAVVTFESIHLIEERALFVVSVVC